MLLQAAKDILCDFAGNAGFESFEDVMSTVTGYVQTQNFNKEVFVPYMIFIKYDIHKKYG